MLHANIWKPYCNGMETRFGVDCFPSGLIFWWQTEGYQISREESLTEATECNLSVQEMSEAFSYLHKMCCFVLLVLCNA